jgi:hypothetical protein
MDARQVAKRGRYGLHTNHRLPRCRNEKTRRERPDSAAWRGAWPWFVAMINPFSNALPKRLYERFLCWILPIGEIELLLRKSG